jgi:hypothetical protein
LRFVLPARIVLKDIIASVRSSLYQSQKRAKVGNASPLIALHDTMTQ